MLQEEMYDVANSDHAYCQEMMHRSRKLHLEIAHDNLEIEIILKKAQ